MAESFQKMSNDAILERYGLLLLGQMAVSRKIITLPQLQESLKAQRECTRKFLGKIWTEQNWVSEESLHKLLKEQQNWVSQNLKEWNHLPDEWMPKILLDVFEISLDALVEAKKMQKIYQTYGIDKSIEEIITLELEAIPSEKLQEYKNSLFFEIFYCPKCKRQYRLFLYQEKEPIQCTVCDIKLRNLRSSTIASQMIQPTVRRQITPRATQELEQFYKSLESPDNATKNIEPSSPASVPPVKEEKVTRRVSTKLAIIPPAIQELSEEKEQKKPGDTTQKIEETKTRDSEGEIKSVLTTQRLPSQIRKSSNSLTQFYRKIEKKLDDAEQKKNETGTRGLKKNLHQHPRFTVSYGPIFLSIAVLMVIGLSVFFWALFTPGSKQFAAPRETNMDLVSAPPVVGLKTSEEPSRPLVPNQQQQTVFSLLEKAEEQSRLALSVNFREASRTANIKIVRKTTESGVLSIHYPEMAEERVKKITIAEDNFFISLPLLYGGSYNFVLSFPDSKLEEKVTIQVQESLDEKAQKTIPRLLKDICFLTQKMEQLTIEFIQNQNSLEYFLALQKWTETWQANIMANLPMPGAQYANPIIKKQTAQLHEIVSIIGETSELFVKYIESQQKGINIKTFDALLKLSQTFSKLEKAQKILDELGQNRYQLFVSTILKKND